MESRRQSDTVRRRALARAFAVALQLVAFLLVPAGRPLAQITSADPAGLDQSPYLEDAIDPEYESSIGGVAFLLATEIALPGPLPGPGPSLVDGKLHIPVAGGLATSAWTQDTEPLITSLAGPTFADETEENVWALAPDGRIRVSHVESGHLLAQKRCRRCSEGWRKKWKLRVSGSMLVPPLVTDDRVFYGGLDNHVYSVKRRNGHRMWMTEVEGRATRQLVFWRGSVVAPDEVGGDPWKGTPLDVVLVVPDNGALILALDAKSGRKVASFSLPEDEGTLVGAPLLTPDGKIVLARQKYAPSDASLMVFDLVKLDAPGESAEPDI